MTAIWDLPLVKSQILLCLIFTTYRLLCQLHTAAWGCEGCHRSQFLPYWLHPVIVSLSHWHSLTSTCPRGPYRLVHHLILCQEKSFWDRPGLLTDRALIESSLVEPSQRARFLAAQAPHSGDWLLALPIANCGLRLNDEAVRVAVDMRLGLSLCVPHNCYCGRDLSGCPRSSRHEDRANHKTTWSSWHHLASLRSCRDLSCRRALWTRQTRWQTSRWANLNPMARWPFVSLGRYSRQPISCFLRWQSRSRRWDSSWYGSHQENREILNHIFSIEVRACSSRNLGVFSSTTLNFISELGHRICVHTGDARETSYLFQRISVTLQRFNSVFLHDTLPVDLPDL